MAEDGQPKTDGDHGHQRPDHDGEFHVALSGRDRELLDELANHMGVSRAETIRRALHLAKSIQDMHKWAGGDSTTMGARGGDVNSDHS